MTGPSLHFETAHGFDFIDDPVLVVTLDGQVREANAAARAFFGARRAAGRLEALFADANPGSAQYLRRASGSTAPRPGRLSFAADTGVGHPRTQASWSRRQAKRTEIILRRLFEASDRFAMLDRRVRELDQKVRKRLQENAVLQEALQQNRTSAAELRHRVKNNIQLMIAPPNGTARRGANGKASARLSDHGYQHQGRP